MTATVRYESECFLTKREASSSKGITFHHAPDLPYGPIQCFFLHVSLPEEPAPKLHVVALDFNNRHLDLNRDALLTCLRRHFPDAVVAVTGIDTSGGFLVVEAAANCTGSA